MTRSRIFKKASGLPSPLAWKPYPENLKEVALGAVVVEVSCPDSPHVVMGAGGKPEREVCREALERYRIPLYKRKGGGGTVLLGPGTIVVTLHAGVRRLFRNRAYFQAINRALMGIFVAWKELDYQQKGLSDIAVGDQKIVGSSIYRRRHYLLYQASILVDFDPVLMAQVLPPPPRPPDYRQARNHAAFLTSLRQLGVQRSLAEMVEDLKAGLMPLSLAELALVESSDAV